MSQAGVVPIGSGVIGGGGERAEPSTPRSRGAPGDDPSSVVGAFATGWLLPRLPAFQQDHPGVDLRVLTNNNRVDIAGECLDYAIRFGDGSWHGAEATPLIAAELSPVCAPEIADRLAEPADLGR